MEMNKSILLSIKPEWVAKILNGEKTIEIRKRPIPVGTKVYIYNTKSKDYLLDYATDEGYFVWNKHSHHYPFKFAGEYGENKVVGNLFNGKVVASFVVDKCELGFQSIEMIENKACLSIQEYERYVDGKNVYAWHISQLKIFDKPKELSEFGIKHAPQSYCYVEEIDL